MRLSLTSLNLKSLKVQRILGSQWIRRRVEMARIYAPNKQYTGISASVRFVNGVGETSDPYLIKWFRERGYKVVEDAQGEEQSVNQSEKEVEEEEAVDQSEQEVEKEEEF